MKEVKFKVRVSCMTFNHSDYIIDTLNGFCVQQTNFPFVCTIIDDASTDGETDIINSFLKENFDLEDEQYSRIEETSDYYLTLARHNNNTNCYFAVILLKYNHYSINKDKTPYVADWDKQVDYIAMCEGDDFWTSPFKLQKECDYLDSHQEKGLVYTNCNVLFHDEKILHENVFTTGFFKAIKGYKDFILEGKYMAPCSWLYRVNELDAIEVPSYVKDWTLFIAFSLLVRHRVGYLNDTTCTYRVSHSSVSHSNDIKNIYIYIKNVYKTEEQLLNDYSDYFDESDVIKWKNRKYSIIVPYAMALGDDEMLRCIKQFKPLKINFKRRILLYFSNCRMLKNYVYNKIVNSIKTGL